MTRTRHFLTGALALAVALVSSGSCFAGAAEMTDAQKACCAAMGHDCGEMSVQSDCCAATSPDSAGFIAVASAASHLSPPAAVVVNTIVAAQPALSVLTSVFDADASKPPGRPTYLVVSVFRI